MLNVLSVILSMLVNILFALIDNSTNYNATKNFEETSAMYKKATENSTSCEELLVNYTFDPLTIIDIDWKPFYFWNYEDDSVHIFKFSPPYPTLVDRFRTELKLKPPVDWNKTVLFMETSNDYSVLLIATEMSGKFRDISNIAFHYDVPYSEIGIKFQKPGFIIMIQCEYRFGMALAPFDHMPDKNTIDEAIASLGIRSEFNQTYLFEMEEEMKLHGFTEAEDIDDDDDDKEAFLYDDD